MNEWIVRGLFAGGAALALLGGLRRRGGELCRLLAAGCAALGILAGLLAGRTPEALLTPLLAVFAAAWVSRRFGRGDGGG